MCRIQSTHSHTHTHVCACVFQRAESTHRPMACMLLRSYTQHTAFKYILRRKNIPTAALKRKVCLNTNIYRSTHLAKNYILVYMA